MVDSYRSMLGASLLLVSALAADVRADDDLPRLAGEWRRVSQETGAEAEKIESDDLLRVRIRGDRLTLWQGETQVEGFEAVLKLTSSTNPKLLDLTLSDGRVLEGIYKIEDKRWTLCLQTDLDVRDRPPTFETKSGEKRTLVVLEKVGD